MMMKRLISIASVAALAVTALMLVQCDELVGGAPTNVRIEAMTDSTVLVSWSAPTEGTPDAYLVYFRTVGSSSYALAAETTATSVEHFPDGHTGQYKVVAKFNSDEYTGANTPTTEPVETPAATVGELNAAAEAGYGWDRVDGDGMAYTMTLASSAPMVDFYITDWAGGYTGPDYTIASPDQAESDPGNLGVVPPGQWKVNSFTNPLTNENGPLPSHSALSYFNYTDITATPLAVGCYTEDGYYALIYIASKNATNGEVQAETWFQLVEGLRLIEH